MRLFLQKNKVIKADIYPEIPVPKKNELLAVPVDNRLWHPKIAMYQNNRKSPQWYKDIESGDGKLRGCYGLGDYMRVGYTIPLWANLDIRPPLSKLESKWDARFAVTENYPGNDAGLFDASFISDEKFRDHFSTMSMQQNQFSYRQTGECPVGNMKLNKRTDYLKLNNPWLIRTAPGYSSLFIQPQWEPNGNYSVLSGVVNTDYYHHCNVVLNITTDKPFSIPEGTPMLHVIPFKRKDAIKKATLLKGDSDIHKLLDNLGFDNVFRAEEGEWEGSYKREQHRRDKELEEDV